MTGLKKHWLLVFFLTLTVFGCEQHSPQSDEPQPADLGQVNKTADSSVQAKKAKTPTNKSVLKPWSHITESGVIRALKLDWEQENSLPRSGSTSLYHVDLFTEFANLHNLKIEWIRVSNLTQMFEYIGANKADVIPRHLTITEKRQALMNFTLPVLRDQEVLIGKSNATTPPLSSDITVSLPKDSAYIESIKQGFPNWKIATLESGLNSDEIADDLVSGRIKYSVLDRRSVDTLLGYRDDIKVLKTLPQSINLAWAVNPKNTSLLAKLNEFVSHHHLLVSSRPDRSVDLNRLKQDNLALRVITRNSPETYFLWRGELMGFEYELMREFAKQNALKLEVIVAKSYQEMKQMLAEGKGDVIAAGLTRTEERKSELNFSIRYKRVSELLVAHKDSPPIKSFEDLKDRTISIRQSSSFWPSAQKLAAEYGVKLVAADESLPTELLIAGVADKSIDLTIADSNLVSIEQRFTDNIITPLTLQENIPYAYAVRKSNPQLLSALNSFIRKEYRGTFYNVIKAKYFASEKRIQRYRQDRITSESGLSPYDQLVKENAKKYQFDWRLITAQMFQESRFNPKSRSAAGARGLMQVLPRTAKELGYSNLEKPKQAIAAGIEYLNWTRDRFSDDLPMQEKIYFALAAYNAGFGHVKDAQKLAKKMGLRSDKWFGHVEKAMLLLQQPKYYNKTRFGYCRGSEPVNYVREIQQRYLSYVDISQ